MAIFILKKTFHENIVTSAQVSKQLCDDTINFYKIMPNEATLSDDLLHLGQIYKCKEIPILMKIQHKKSVLFSLS